VKTWLDLIGSVVSSYIFVFSRLKGVDSYVSSYAFAPIPLLVLQGLIPNLVRGVHVNLAAVEVDLGPNVNGFSGCCVGCHDESACAR
jgi:hypothetical protein